MKIKASVELTTEELLAILTEHIASEYSAGKSYGRIPGGGALDLVQTSEQGWLIQWGDKPEPPPEPISPPLPVAPEEKGTLDQEVGPKDDVPF